MASMRSRHLSSAQGCAGLDVSAPASPLFLGHGWVGAGLPMFGQSICWWLRRSGAAGWAKTGPLCGLRVVWLQDGGLGSGRRSVRGRSTRLGCVRAAMATRVALLLMVDVWRGGLMEMDERWGALPGRSLAGQRWRHPRASFPS